MIFWYLISIIFGMLAMFTNSLGMLLAAVIVAGVATFTDR